MQPLPFVSHPASVAFAVAVGCFAVIQLVTGTVTDVRKRRSRADVARLDRGSLPFVVACCAVGVLLGLLAAYHLPRAGIATGVPAVRWTVFVLGLVAVVAGSALRLAAIL